MIWMRLVGVGLGCGLCVADPYVSSRRRACMRVHRPSWPCGMSSTSVAFNSSCCWRRACCESSAAGVLLGLVLSVKKCKYFGYCCRGSSMHARDGRDWEITGFALVIVALLFDFGF